jgi:hypothetical protein
LKGIEADAGHRLINKPGILPSGEPQRGVAAIEQDLPQLPFCQPQIVVNGGSGLIGDFKPHRPARLFLADYAAVNRVSAEGDILDADCKDIVSPACC